MRAFNEKILESKCGESTGVSNTTWLKSGIILKWHASPENTQKIAVDLFKRREVTLTLCQFAFNF